MCNKKLACVSRMLKVETDAETGVIGSGIALLGRGRAHSSGPEYKEHCKHYDHHEQWGRAQRAQREALSGASSGAENITKGRST
eukprot:972865-Pelagomonas_calceolata.AAC.2